MTLTHLPLGAAPDPSLLLAIGIPVAALALALTGWAARRRKARTPNRLGSPAVKVAALAAVGCTAYSADTSWRFAADFLDMAGVGERIGMFAAAELALFATALMARQNLAVQGAPGLPGTLVWVITGVQVVPAFAESGPIGGTVRAFVGPIMAAMLWHQAMGIELRLRTPGAASHGLLAVLGREARERLLSRLGIAARDRDAAQITADRATARAVALVVRLAERTPKQQQGWRGRGLTRRLSKAIGRAGVGTDPRQRAELLDQLAARRHALALATVPLPSPWSPLHDQKPAATVPSPKVQRTTVPTGSPPSDTVSIGGRGPRGDRAHRGPGTGDHTGTGDRVGAGDHAGTTPTGDPGPGTNTGTGDQVGTGDHAGTTPTGDPGPGTNTGTGDQVGTGDHAGTTPTGDPGPGTNTGTGDQVGTGDHAGTTPTGDPGPETNTGTGDQGHKVPLRRKPTPRTTTRGSRSHSPQTQRPPRGPEQTVEQLVQQLRPHVPPLLDRDGNETVTRVQLREILRREGLVGGRNDRLSLVLQQLRSETSTTARSTTR
ncbi:membrane protein [Streptomyces caniferus]|uniref:Membrane protein n=2 Tax=Streptomyces caniferus TaxID=285557 RepID=A0A640SLL0_9ACTN|nr:hypothetical protein [Streptomyces caniferus]GFE11632.1 membrane protein [Streptomyces caniferus]